MQIEDIQCFTKTKNKNNSHYKRTQNKDTTVNPEVPNLGKKKNRTEEALHNSANMKPIQLNSSAHFSFMRGHYVDLSEEILQGCWES